MKKIIMTCVVLGAFSVQGAHAETCVEESTSALDFGYSGYVQSVDEAPKVFEEKNKAILAQAEALGLTGDAMVLTSKDYNVYQLNVEHGVSLPHDINVSYYYKTKDSDKSLALAKALNDKGFEYDFTHNVEVVCE